VGNGVRQVFLGAEIARCLILSEIGPGSGVEVDGEIRCNPLRRTKGLVRFDILTYRDLG